MPAPVRFAVVGEGRDEHGLCGAGPNLHALPQDALRGVIVTLVHRLLSEWFDRRGEAVCWLLEPSRSSGGKPIPPGGPPETLVSENRLPRLLDRLLNPIRTTGSQLLPADFVVLCVDDEHRDGFGRTISRLRPDLRQRAIPVVFEPEMEILLVQCKEPLEQAVGIPLCTSIPPCKDGDLKDCLKQWLRNHAPGHTLDAKLRQTIASYVSLDRSAALCGIRAWVQLTEGVIRAVNG